MGDFKFAIKVNRNPNPFYDASELLGTISSLSEDAVTNFLAERAKLGPHYKGAKVIDFEIDPNRSDCADAAIAVGSDIECFSIECISNY